VPPLRARNRSHDHARVLVLAAAVVALAASACAPSGGAATADPGPSFHRVSNDALRFSQPISSVTQLMAPAAQGEPWRIFGSMLEPATGQSTAAVWTSDDGRGWDRQDIDRASSARSESIAAATRLPNGILAVGRVGDEGSSDAAVWSSEGDSWKMTAPRAMGGKHDQWAFDVAVGQGGIVVAGGENDWGEIRPRMWFSPDGTTWRSVDGGPGGPLDKTGEESVQAVSALGNGFLAVGWRDYNGEQDGIAWYSPDGTTWQQVDAPTLGGPGRQNVQSVTSFNNVAIAGGFIVDGSGQGKPVVWRSNDGKTWTPPSSVLPLNDDGRNAASDMSVRSFSASGNELFAAGGDDWRPTMWSSRDGGVTWQLLGSTSVVHGGLFEDGVALVDVAKSGNNVVALGAEPTVLQLQNGRWIDATGDRSFPTGGSRPAATTVLADQGQLLTGGYHIRSPGNGKRERYTARVWLGRGAGLTEVKPEGQAQHLSAGKINDIARFKAGYVAVGFEDFSVADKRSAADGKPDGLIWTSPNGKRWTRRAAELAKADPQLIATLEGDPNVLAQAAYDVIASQPMITEAPAGGPGTRSLEAVAPLGNGYIAVGSAYRDVDGNPQTKGDYDTDPVVITSADGNAIVGEDAGLSGPGTQRFRDVCVRDGEALAVGVSGTDNSFDVAVRLRGRDGKWQVGRATDDSFHGPEGSSQDAFACAASSEGFVLVGSDNSRGNSDARVWMSRDGLSWHKVVSGSLGGPGEQAAKAVAAVPDGGWLIGGVDTIAGDSDVALWRMDSSGLITRRDRDEPSLGGPGTQSVSSIAVSSNHATIVGEDATGVGLWETSHLDR
jgi:hypothetical protein